MTKILVLVGPHGGGKDYYADNIVNEPSFKVDFKDKMLEMLSIYENLPLTDKVFYEQWKKQPENRRKLQVFGTEVIRNNVDDDFWVDACFFKIDDNLRINNLIINRDTRFSNEFDMFRMMINWKDVCVEFRFMNYHNLEVGYSEHTSELAAQELIKMGYKHHDIIQLGDVEKIIKMDIK